MPQFGQLWYHTLCTFHSRAKGPVQAYPPGSLPAQIKEVYKRYVMQNTFTELIWLFLIYSFLGWIFEAVVGTVKNRKFTNRGFSTGPFCPVYGFAAAAMQTTLSELVDNPVFLLIGCGIEATVIEWYTGKLLERLNRHKWWDYSNKKWNFDGYICFQYTLLWAVLGAAAVRYGNTFFLLLFELIPQPVPTVIVWILSIYMALDAAVSVAAVFHLRGSGRSREKKSRLASMVYKAAVSVITVVEHRMTKAYPVIEEKTEEILKEGKFAEGCGFYKLFWLFLTGAFLGDIVETVFCRLTAGVWMSRSSLVWGPFSIVWGLAIVLATSLLYKDREKPDRHIFIIGTFLGGAYEYICSVFTEIVFGQVFWDYSEIPFNLGGRINLLYCFFWGIAAVAWIKLLYPKISGLIERIPKIAGYVVTWILVVFMAADITVSSAALVRYSQRDGGPAASSGWEQLIDSNFDDGKMQRIYPNAKQR